MPKKDTIKTTKTASTKKKSPNIETTEEVITVKTASKPAGKTASKAADKTTSATTKARSKVTTAKNTKKEADVTPLSAPKLDFDLDNFSLDDLDLSDVEYSDADEESYIEADKVTAAPTADALDLRMELKLSENSAENNFVQMAKFKTLTAEEEKDLAKRIEVGLYADHLLEEGKVSKKDIKDYEWLVEDGKRAKTIFTNANRKLISNTIKTMSARGSAKMANINTMTIYGQMGLDIAISKYDYKLNWRFSTYAKERIQATITRELTKNQKLVRNPQHIVEKIYKMHKTAMEFESSHGREPSIEELAELMEAKIDEVKLYKDAETTEKSVYDNIGDTDGSVYIDTVEDENLDGIFDAEIKSYENTRLREVLGKIATKDEKAKEAFSLYYGFSEDGRVDSKTEIGKILGVGEQQVDNLIHRAEAKVCHPAFGLLSDFSDSQA